LESGTCCTELARIVATASSLVERLPSPKFVVESWTVDRIG